MNEPYLADFYRGWTIEINQEADGFRSSAYSSGRKRLGQRTCYPSETQALIATKRLIDWQFACDQLSLLLRQWYEEGTISFEEWRLLFKSMHTTVSVDSGL
ncbi:MAG TPA: hypothetical protein IGS37_03795 [Synechococcales cyanobacterium M55_K2018_004]|nr:hypothetical protein [Synechococcales cyanobacterium M55_K2018_004]